MLSRFIYLELQAMYSFVPTEHDPLVNSWPRNRMNCSINKPPALLKSCTFSMYSIRKSCRIHPHKILGLQQVLVPQIDIINYLLYDQYVVLIIIQHNLVCIFNITILKMFLSSDSDLPNKVSRSHHLFG